MTAFAVVIVSPNGYTHSHAFDEVAESIRWGLEAIGHDAVISTMPVYGRRSIVLGAHLLPMVPWRLTSATNPIIYNLEQITRESPWFGSTYVHALRSFATWEYSAENARKYPLLTAPSPKAIVPVGYAPTLTRIAKAEEDIDVLFYGCMNGRRAAIMKELVDRGYNVLHVFDVYDGERDALIARSKIVLNVHFYEAQVFEVVRVSYLLANSKCVVSEGTGHPSMTDEVPFARGVAFAPYHDLPDTIAELLADPSERAYVARAGHDLMTTRPMSSFVRAALDAER